MPLEIVDSSVWRNCRTVSPNAADRALRGVQLRRQEVVVVLEAVEQSAPALDVEQLPHLAGDAGVGLGALAGRHLRLQVLAPGSGCAR